MDIAVEYKDTKGVKSNRSYRMSRLAFAKHLAIAGQGYAPQPNKLMRAIAMFVHYGNYMRRHEFSRNRFSLPPDQLYDPTEKGQFSNLAGKAIADFLSKRIDNSHYTVNYEAAMKLLGMPIKGPRPDLLAFDSNKRLQFAMEAKGFSDGTGNMADHKAQAGSGDIHVNFTVACVSHHLYNRVKCKYHDPIGQNIPFNTELFAALTKQYYSGLKGFLNRKLFEYNEVEHNGEGFYEIRLSRRFFKKMLPMPDHLPPEFFFHYLDFYDLTLLLPVAIHDYAERGLSTDLQPFKYSSDQETDNLYRADNIYIDYDRVGLRIRTF